MKHKNSFIIVNDRDEVVSRFDLNVIYNNREEAIIAGQNFCRDFEPDEDGQIVYFRTIHAN